MKYSYLRIKIFVPLLISLLMQSNCFAAADEPELLSMEAAPDTPILNIAAANQSAVNPFVTSQSPDSNRLTGHITTDPIEAMHGVDDLTKQILLKIIELEKFNLHYSMEVAKQGRWKGWRYGAFQEVNAGMGLAGAIIGTANRGSHLGTPTRVWTSVQENACFIPMIGSIIGASAAALELMINEYHDIQAGHKGFSPRKARNYVWRIRNDIDDLLSKRDELLNVESSSAPLSAHVQVDQLEGKVLRDLRDQGILEFERFHVGARRLLAFQQSQYLFDLSKFTLNAIGFEFAYLSLHRHHRVWNYRAGVMWDIAGPLYMFGPIVSRVIGKGVGEMHKHYLRSVTDEAHDSNIKDLEADCGCLNEAYKKCEPPSVTALVERSEIYKLQNRNFQKEISSGLKQRDKAKLTATQNIGAGMFVGSLKLAQGILFTIPGYYHAYNTKTPRASRVTNTDLFAGSVVSLPAGVFSMLDTLRIQVRGEINRHKAIKEGRYPSQIVAARLKELDEIESKLTATPGANTSPDANTSHSPL